jgi:hypothetical protein
MERKLSHILVTIFVAFNYGVGMPLLFFYIMFPILILTIFDKILLVYWFKPEAH